MSTVGSAEETRARRTAYTHSSVMRRHVKGRGRYQLGGRRTDHCQPILLRHVISWCAETMEQKQKQYSTM